MGGEVFITGGTGYIGSRLIPALQQRGHSVTALLRDGSQKRLAVNCPFVVGNALDGDSYSAYLRDSATFIHLVGVSHPSPSKAREFEEVDLKAGREAIRVAVEAGIRHFIYVSVAQPAPVMKAYVRVRSTCEAVLRQAGLNATILRPWYVLGPGHRWPALLAPFYRAAEWFPSTREGALRLGLVTIDQIVRALTGAAENPPAGVRLLGVPEIRACRIALV